jgi:hypothetical protein
MYKQIYIFVLILLMSCASDNASISQNSAVENIKYFSSFEFNKYGIPELKNEISSSNIPENSYYFQARYLNNRPDNVYIVKDEKIKTDPLKPFKVIYQWTGKGFDVGYENSKGIIEFSSAIAYSITINNVPITAVPGYIVGTTVFVVSGITGFIIGLGKSVPETYNEIKNSGKTNGLVLGKYLFEYDPQNRIIKYTQYSPLPENIKLSETTFSYYGNLNTPFKTINYSFVEKKKRIIYQQ